jgi:3-dehydroquinate synthase
MYSLNVELPVSSYPIYIKKGLLDEIGSEIKKIYQNKKIVIITDSNIENFYGEKIEASLAKEGFSVNKIVLQPGEKNKSFEILQRVCNSVLEFGLNRSDLIIAFGGGVIGDLAGFAASILFRGIPFIQVPTSLLAQIDSSIGGKVAINSTYGKNLIGSFYQPKAVFIDPNLLLTLSDRYFNDGMAEVIKYGAISDKSLFNKLLEINSKDEFFQTAEQTIFTCCSIKKNLVEIDEKDNGPRMLLNFGHTIGHAIEKIFNYEGITHGEAVAIGMYIITKNSEYLGITQKGTTNLIKEILSKYNLPYELPNINETEVLKNIKLDKKNSNNGIHIILINSIGDGFIKKIDLVELSKFTNLNPL